VAATQIKGNDRISGRERNIMNSVPKISRWREGRVDCTKEHFELRYGSDEDGGWSDWTPVAVVGPPVAGTVKVQFLVRNPSNADVVSEVKQEIQYYLFDLKESNPWLYAKYHCGTMSNLYGNVHWSFFQAGNRAEMTRKNNAFVKDAARNSETLIGSEENRKSPKTSSSRPSNARKRSEAVQAKFLFVD
jgi:hypothetical protein